MNKIKTSELRKIKKPAFFYGYTIILASFFIQAIAWGITNSFGIFFAPLMNEFSWSRATISGAASLCFLVHGLSSMVLGNLNDRLGPRFIMSICGIFLGLGFWLMAKVISAWQLYLFYGLVVGIGLGGIDVIPLSTVTRWFKKKRGLMTGIIKVGTGVGMLIMPFFITWLLKGYGWRISFTVLAVIITVSVIFLSQFLVRDPIRKAQLIDNENSNTSGNLNKTEEGLNFQEAIRTRQLWTICAIYFIILFCAYTILIHIVQHAIDLGIPAAVAAGVLATVGGVSISGRIVMGEAGDKIGEKPALVVCLLFLLTALCWLQIANTLWMFYLFAIFYGFAHGGFFSLGSPLIAKQFGTRIHGLLYGIVIFSSTIGGAIGPFMAGDIFDVTHSYKIVFLILAVLCIIAISLSASLQPPIKGKRLQNELNL